MNNSSNFIDYYHHLSKTSIKGDSYKKYILFPFISKVLKSKYLDILINY